MIHHRYDCLLFVIDLIEIKAANFSKGTGAYMHMKDIAMIFHPGVLCLK